MRRLLLLFIIMLLGMNSLLYSKQSSSKQLQKNISIWEQFHWEGIIQVQSSAFAMRKYFVLSKNKEAMRLDILDSGIIGLTAQPLVSLYIKDSIILNAPSVKQLEGIDPNWFFPKNAIGRLVHFSDSLLSKQEEILSSHKFKSGKTIFQYDKKYRLSLIKNTDIGFEAKVLYNRNNQPTTISITYAGEPLTELQITDREYNSIEIVPLEQIQNKSDVNSPTPDNPDRLE